MCPLLVGHLSLTGNVPRAISGKDTTVPLPRSTTTVLIKNQPDEIPGGARLWIPARRNDAEKAHHGEPSGFSVSDWQSDVICGIRYKSFQSLTEQPCSSG